MGPISGAGTLQWAMIGLVTGAEVFGALPRAAAGRIADYLNSGPGSLLVVSRATTEDVDQGAEVPELLVLLAQITYVQPWGVTAGVENLPVPPRGATPIQLQVLLRSRIAVSGTIHLPTGVDLGAMLSRTDETFLGFGRAALVTPAGERRPADGVLVNRSHILLARRLGS